MVTLPRAVGARERLDGPLPPAELRATLDDPDFLNAWFGGYALTFSRIRRVASRLPRGRPLVVVDVGGGRGDFAVALVRWARRPGVGAVCVEHFLLTAPLIDTLRRGGLSVTTGTLNERALLDRVLPLRPDAVTSDRPHALRAAPLAAPLLAA